MRKRKEYLINTIISVVSILVVLVVAEFIMQIASPSPGYYVWKRNFSATLNVQESSMPGIHGDSEFTITKDGYRGSPKNEMAKLKILTIGGSTTECFYLDDSEAWPFLLEQNLNRARSNYAWVGNIGRSGHNASHHLITLEKGIDQYGELDMILFMVGINDVMKSLNHSQGIVLDERSLEDQTFMEKPASDTLSFFGKMKLYQLITNTFRSNKATADNHHVQDKSGTAYDKWRLNRKNNIGMLDTIPVLSDEKLHFADNVESMIEYCKENDIQPVFILQPTMYTAELDSSLESLLWMGGLGDFQGAERCRYYSTYVLYTLMNQYNDVVRNICEEEEVHCIDVTTELPKDTTVFYDDCHFNESGAELLAEQVSRYILTHFD